MSEKRDPQELQEIIRRANNGGRVFVLRMVALAFVLYMLINVIVAYFQGGTDAPSIVEVVVGIVVLGGGSIAVGLFSYRTYVREKKAADEARAELRALEAEEQAEAAPELEEGEADEADDAE